MSINLKSASALILGSFVTLTNAALATSHVAPERPVVQCDDGSSHGYVLEIFADANGFTRADLSVNDFVEPYLLSSMTVCRELEIDHTITDGPWTVATCNNTEWNDRYDVDYVVAGWTPNSAVVRHNEVELVTLTCRDL